MATVGFLGRSPLISVAVAFAAMLALTPLVIRLARRFEWVAHPQANRWHKEPTAQMGGIAIFGAVVLAVLLTPAHDLSLWPIYSGATLMFLVGLVDDCRGVAPATKLIAQVVATMLLLYTGYAFGQGGAYWLTIPLTFLWVIGVTNAVNLIDGMDGLAAGLASITAVMLAIFSALAGGGLASTAIILAVAGASAGFLVFNFKPASIFMGDCGSLFLGYSIAAFAIVTQGQVGGRASLAVYLASVAVLAVPIFDTTLVTFVRLLHGRRVTQSGNDHTMHRLAMLGMSERKTVLTLYAISVAFGMLALTFHFAAVKFFYAVAAFFVVGLVVFGIHIGGVKVYEDDELDGASAATSGPSWGLSHSLGEMMRAAFGGGWKAVVGVAGDLSVIAAAFIVAHYLRYEDGLSLTREASLMTMLPGLVGVKAFVFFGGGLYKGLWRRAGTPELVRIAAVSTLASVLAYGVFVVPFGIDYLSEAVFFIDWMIVTIAVTGTRFGFRGLRQYLSAQRETGRRVLLYGAGDAGILTLRRLRQNTDVRFHPVGFIDDDAAKRGLSAQGLSVLGAFEDLPRICRERGVEEVLITAFGMSTERKQEIYEACGDIPVQCRVFDVSLYSFSERRPETEARNVPGLPTSPEEAVPDSALAPAHAAQHVL